MNITPAVDTTKQVVTLPSGWFDLAEPIVLRDRVDVVIQGDGTTVINYVGDKSKFVVELVNSKRCQITGIREIRCNGAAGGVMIRGVDGSPISSIDNVVQGPIQIHQGKVGIQVGTGEAKSVSENKFNDVEMNGRDAGFRVISGNGQNQYLTRCRFAYIERGIGIDLVRGGLHTRDCIYTALKTAIRVGDPNNVIKLDGDYSEECDQFLITSADHSPNPGSCTMIACHVQGSRPVAGLEWLGPCVVRWALPGPFNAIGCELTGSVLGGGAQNTPLNFMGCVFKTRDPLRRINDTGTFLATGCQFRDDVAIRTEPFTRLEVAGLNGPTLNVLSWGPQESRGIWLGTVRNTRDHWDSATLFDGGGVIGGGRDKPETWPAVKETP